MNSGISYWFLEEFWDSGSCIVPHSFAQCCWSCRRQSLLCCVWCWRRCWDLVCICCCLRSCVWCCWLLTSDGDKTLRLRAGRGARHSCSRQKTTGIFGSAWCVALGHPCPRQKATGTFGSVWRAALGIPVHGKGLREYSASLGAGRGEFLSTVNDNGNRRPRVRRHAGDFCPR